MALRGRGDSCPAGETARPFSAVCVTCRYRGRRAVVPVAGRAACSDRGGKHHGDSDCGGLPEVADPSQVAPKDDRQLTRLFFDQLAVLEEGTPECQYARNTLI